MTMTAPRKGLRRSRSIASLGRLALMASLAGLVQACGGLGGDAEAASQQVAQQPNDFVRIEGGQFTIDGEPYRFVGTNFWFGAYLGADGAIGDRERLRRELDLLQSLGITNLRILAASELSPLPNSIQPAFQNSAGETNQQLLEGLDFLLAEMGRRDMRAVLYLGNFWDWSGGFTTYLHWEEGRELVELGNPEVEFWPAYAHLAADFYSSRQAMDRYRAYATQLLTRRNSVTGQLYASDPTIMSWQLANEPRPGVEDARGEATVPIMAAWIKDSAQLIKSFAPHQLVSIGNEGTMGCIQSQQCFLSVGGIEEVDYLTFHMWPKNWSWIDSANMEATYPRAVRLADAYIDEHLTLARELGKPIVLEEFGLERDEGAVSPESTVRFRDRFVQHVLARVEADAQACGHLAGTNYWAWGGYGRAHRTSAKWENGDTVYLGDPPQEPQGLNSIFASDGSTLALLSTHAATLAAAADQCRPG